MELKEYQPLARRTMKELAYNKHMEHMGLGVIGEVGELCDAVKKAYVYGRPVNENAPEGPRHFGLDALDRVHMHEEAGDAFWYIVGYLPELNISSDTLQNGFVDGLERSVGWTQGAARLVAQVQTQMSQVALDLMTDSQPGEMQRVTSMQILGRNMGLLFGFFDMDLGAALTANIAKLAKRHGAKYNDVGVLNRDVAAERSELEQAMGASPGSVATLSGTMRTRK